MTKCKIVTIVNNNLRRMAKIITALLVSLVSLLALGTQAAPDVPHTHRLGIEWDNARPEQRQALDHFYQSIQQQPLQNNLDQRLLRQERVEQLRGMTPEQRQQMMLDFTRQYQNNLPR